MYNFGECETLSNNKKIVLSEKHCKITFINHSQIEIRKILIDGCVITDGKRCDYLLIMPNGIEHYVELKGCDLKHAVIQLITTIKRLHNNYKRVKKYCYVISTRCPVFSPQIQLLKKKFKKNFNSGFIVKNIYYEHVL